MNGFILAPAALGDLEDIWDYYTIELQNPEAADRIRDELFAAFRKLVKTPGLGHFRSDLAKEPPRFWRVRSFLVIYRSEKRPIETVRILLGARDLQVIIRDGQ